MIRSVGDRGTELVWLCERASRIDPRIRKAANRKLHLLDAAMSLHSLRVPGESVGGVERRPLGAARHSVNDQLRICFV
ncbi:plasmid maintenance system killer [Dermabacter vaginalis]|uniref:Plasmid maintenance system killer n=1 Tax=Dermabacter vaginalis TaxID=1630135 RepID=A0ABX6A543_9MICO|nr:plasmid maintenance system killer [Dermabacter vaginalis]